MKANNAPAVGRTPFQKWCDKYQGLFYLIPWIIGFVVFKAVPFGQSLYYSFTDMNFFNGISEYGLMNYIDAFTTSRITKALITTFQYSFITVPLKLVFALFIAYILNFNIKFVNLFRTVYFMPNLIGGILLGYIWQILLNGVLANLGKPLLALDERYGFIGLVILMCWQQIGYMMIIYVAGLQSVPGDLIEAAKIDGATGREILFKIKVPLVMPSITICTFLTLTNSFKLFDQNVALTGGEPANLSEMLALNIYSTFYGRSGAQWKGIGQAKAVVFFLIVVVISLVQLHFTRSKEVQS